MMSTKIEWADEVWNPVTGCTKVSEGCANCYAEGIAKRFWGEREFSIVQGHLERLLQPLKWKKPRKIFVCSMGDLFHPDVDDYWIDDVFAVMAMTPQHTYQILTKRPERMLEYFQHIGGTTRNDWILSAAARILNRNRFENFPVLPFKNVWLGVTAENQLRADERIPLLLNTPAAVRFVSCEPLIERVNLKKINMLDEYYINPLIGESWQPLSWIFESTPTLGTISKINKLDWVICGGESGPKARPMHPDWAKSLRDQCQKANVPFFFKQWGEWLPSELYSPSIAPSASQIKIDGQRYYRTGKKSAGRLLDGQEWSEFPE
jgi:protein gp37